MPKQVIYIPKPKLFDFDLSLWFLDRNLDDCMHEVREHSVRKLLSFNGKPVLVEISEKQEQLQVEVLSGKISDPAPLIAFINEWFDLYRDLKPFYRLLKKDADLLPLLQYKGFHIVGIPDFFEVLCWCVIGQQINLGFAYKIKRRLVEQYGQSLEYNQKKYYIFPRPEVLQLVSVDELRAMQMTGRKAEYIIGIAKLFTNGMLSKEKIMALGDEALMKKELLGIRGIGEWTANYALMKGIRALNCVPYGDAGINNALYKLKGFDKKNNRAATESFFAAYEGWKAYLVFYLWFSLRERVQ